MDSKNIKSSIPEVSILITPKTPEQAGLKSYTPTRRKRLSGAELKRRRKARLAAEARALSTASEPSTSLKSNPLLPPCKDAWQPKPQGGDQTGFKNTSKSAKRRRVVFFLKSIQL